MIEDDYMILKRIMVLLQNKLRINMKIDNGKQIIVEIMNVKLKQQMLINKRNHSFYNYQIY